MTHSRRRIAFTRIFWVNSAVRLTDVSDGTNCTVAVGEIDDSNRWMEGCAANGGGSL